jgi:hypothetical protein
MTENDYELFANQMEEKYPKIFSGRYGGFAVGAGWWPIIEALCGQIQHHIDWKEKQRQWAITFNSKAAPEELREVPDAVPQVTVEQIKEKFGGLRFYYQGGDDTVGGMVRMAERWADYSCEECGKPGTKRSGGWIKTLCDEHEAERQKRYESYAKQNGLEL